ncbi:hypothetical protein FOA43_002720 [Brettanomyces nanus]|uniref:Glutamate--tRNA ligase, mitochondrial n=1 Tax=Eeniella nana TaxID=13502 RepID=A0A875RV93_EENNA|nr:uncharacterized protein FOA43_002720 [Brettanomyces nanus]QPG75367.1 hypothetical protein FOA43_002720 [Brettanomyces nanus]
MALHQQILKLSTLIQELVSNVDEYETLKSVSDTAPTIDSNEELTSTLRKIDNSLKYIEILFEDEFSENEYDALVSLLGIYDKALSSLPEVEVEGYTFDRTKIEEVRENANGENGGGYDEDMVDMTLNPSISSKHKKSVRFKDNLVDAEPTKYKDDRDVLFQDNESLSSQASTTSQTSSQMLSNKQIFISNQQEIINQDQTLDHLGDSVSRQHEMSLQINGEVNDHMVLLDDLENGMDRTNVRLIRGQRNIRRFREALRERGDWCTILPAEPAEPVRARFAPSPTGFLHLGSLRTALYNYLAAKSTHGQFLLRLEDTDQKRLVQGAEQNIYETLKWLGMNIDEGPIQGGPYFPYRQSDRSKIYAKYVRILLDKGFAYRCYCSKHRLDQLRDSARLLKPPTTASYDRYCLNHYTKEQSDVKCANGEEFTVRFVSPKRYPIFTDLLHGEIDQQIQINPVDVRYEDPVLLKSDGLPTYHMANVIDDHLMKITHVIRGEEWLASTPKHVALYNAFGWKPPKFIHIPLLTTVDNRKLSKRSGDIDIMSLKAKGYLPEALINFSVLFGWSPKRTYGKKSSEIFSLQELENEFSLEGLTKGNAKVDFSKLEFFNKHYLGKKLADTESEFYKKSLDDIFHKLSTTLNLPHLSKNEVDKVLTAVGSALSKVDELDTEQYWYFFIKPSYSIDSFLKSTKLDTDTIRKIVQQLRDNSVGLSVENMSQTIKQIAESIPGIKRKSVYQTLRYALSGPQSGTNMHTIINILGMKETENRIADFAEALNHA